MIHAMQAATRSGHPAGMRAPKAVITLLAAIRVLGGRNENNALGVGMCGATRLVARTSLQQSIAGRRPAIALMRMHPLHLSWRRWAQTRVEGPLHVI